MGLDVGMRVNVYDVTGKLGEGAMGEVYRARDTTLDRDVALKVLPDSFTADPDRLGRFQREAKVLASLNHPNIGGIYGLETSGENQALVLELIEGPTLAERIAEGPVSADQAISMVRQMAEALSAAHDAGVVHRDLKPANIKVRPDGTVKVLDFGLAKAVEGSAAGAESSDAPTITAMSSQVGAIIGTAAYMSPEQARGEDVDKRSDIWALGCVAYELLTGRRAFEGRTMSDTLASVLAREPDIAQIPREVPTAFRKFIKRCLEKEPNQRLRDATEGILQLEERLADGEAAENSNRAERPPATYFWQKPAVAASILLLVSGAMAGLAVVLWPEPVPEVTRALLTPSNPTVMEARFDRNIAITPDGNRVVYKALTGGQSQYFVRVLSELEASPLTGLTPNIRNIFISPEGDRVGFFDGNRAVQRVSILGGPPVDIAEIPAPPRGATWGPDDEIIFAAGNRGLFRVSVAGGALEQLTEPDTAMEETSHMWPEYLPGGRAVLFSIRTTGPLENSQIAVLDLETGDYRTLFPGGSNPIYSPTGHIIYGVSGTLRAVLFDAQNLEVLSEPIPVVDQVAMGPRGGVNFSISDNGTLVYISGSAGGDRGLDLTWVDRDGREESLDAESGDYYEPYLSPDGSRVAVRIGDTGGDSSIHVYDIERNNFTQFTFDGAAECCPVFTPDGERIAFASNRSGTPNLYIKNADGTGEVERLTDVNQLQFPNAWSPDGDSLVLSEGGDVFKLSVGSDGQAVPLVSSEFREHRAALSPDGAWIAYESNEDGDPDIYVRPFPDVEDGKWKVSTRGGRFPIWGADSQELFYVAGRSLMFARVTTTPSFDAGNPEVLLEGLFASERNFTRAFDVNGDGERLLVMKETVTVDVDSDSRQKVVLALNWFEELEARVPAE